MESIQKIFSATISENKESDKLYEIISELTFELSKKKIQRLKDEAHIQNRLGELFEFYTKALDSDNIKTTGNINAVIDGLVKAASFDKEEFLYKSIYEKEQLEKSIIDQKASIRTTIQATFATLEEHIEKLDESIADESLKALNDAKLKGIEMLGILKETTTEALLTTLEKASDVEDTTFEITKNLTYQAINEGEFTKSRFLEITQSILEVTIEIADEDQGFAKDLLLGSIHGTKEGIAKAIDKFKNDLKFAPEEIDEVLEKDLASVKKELIKIEEDYIDMLESLRDSTSGISHQVIRDILESEFNTSFAKIRRVAHEARETVADKIEELGILESEFVERAEKRFASFKEDAEERFEAFEKAASKKVEELKQNERAVKAASEAKRLGNRAWEVAKSMMDGALKGAKDAMKKDK